MNKKMQSNVISVTAKDTIKPIVRQKKKDLFKGARRPVIGAADLDIL
jgi:hypothetical protein